MSKRLNHYFSYELVKTNEKKLQEHYPPSSSKTLVPDPSCWMGIEVEVENYHPGSLTLEFPNHYWGTTTDNSLRTAGIEFISIPLRGVFLVDAVEKLEKYLQKASPSHDFNRRTSVHVHVGVRYLTVRQLLNVLLAYLTVEPLLYAFAEKYTGYKRKDNNFCVPIAQSALSLNLPQILKESDTDEYLAIATLPKRWKKYTGLNLCPIATQGTIEFRHLGGTIDSKILLKWLGYLQNLRGFGKNTSTEELLTWIKSLNSNSNYAAYVATVLGPDALTIVNSTELKELLEDSIETTKEIIGWSTRNSLVTLSETELITTKFYQRLGPKVLKTSKDNHTNKSTEEAINNLKYQYSTGLVTKDNFFTNLAMIKGPPPLKIKNFDTKQSLLEGL